MVNVVFGLYLLLHGIAHLVGFVVPWKLMTVEEMPYRTTLLAGRLEAGAAGVRVVGLLWLAAAVAFAVAAWWTFGARNGWVPLVASVTVASLLLCVIGLPDSRIGLVANGVVLVVLVLNARWHWVEA